MPEKEAWQFIFYWVLGLCSIKKYTCIGKHCGFRFCVIFPWLSFADCSMGLGELITEAPRARGHVVSGRLPSWLGEPFPTRENAQQNSRTFPGYFPVKIGPPRGSLAHFKLFPPAQRVRAGCQTSKPCLSPVFRGENNRRRCCSLSLSPGRQARFTDRRQRLENSDRCKECAFRPPPVSQSHSVLLVP